jgi:hypothetical protein
VHAEGVPRVSSLEALHRAVAEFVVADPGLVIEPSALAAARRSLDCAGLLLLGEVHGVRENPLLIRALLQAFGLTTLALEWPDDLAPAMAAFLAGEPLADHELLWFGDGRITAGHLAVLAERAAAGPLELILFDGAVDAGWSWSQRDEAMAGRILAAAPADTPTLAVAGSYHTATSPIDLGVPMGAQLAQQRPGIREIAISYGSGRFYNAGPRQFQPSSSPQRHVRLHQQRGKLILDLPSATEAVVPQRPQPWPMLAHPSP